MFMQIEKMLYTTQATAVAGRRTQIVTPCGNLQLDLSTPVELGGTNGRGATAEQLFAACHAASFLTMLRLVSSKEGVALPSDAQAEATVAFGTKGDGYGIEVELRVRLPGLQRADADNLAIRAHDLCAYSCAIRESTSVRVLLA
ncbi:Ohr family peroxiredoxin (plasmid) [Rhizobium sp. CC1099]|uniref:Ohr family peroxiredoxin n=1 Tax=Rhizobium sp. CC1099 TaxID=3039160 RepID=UPI0024B07829|nr:Ohr family peroxiredoxin [Rhizobium sp. CC1099]WFU91350.1 Ohr family peroxiredoxin [Rhizobium sp. CC1099]